VKVKKKTFPFGRRFSCFPARMIEQDLFQLPLQVLGLLRIVA
jgi:hypothetical protein